MFAGLDDIAWGAMEHAYGPAVEVPDLLRGLVSADPAVRERALDGMYGAVHHQGDVYECTLASVPFLLEAAGDPTLPGRGAIVRLLASIGGADWDDEDDEEEDDGAPVMCFGPARRAVAAACPLFVGLLADADPEVRCAAPAALLVCRADGHRVVAVLQERLREETDPAVRAAIVTAVGTFGRRAAAGHVAGVDPVAVGAWLAELAGSRAGSALRLVAVAELARCAPASLPPDIVPTVGDLFRDVYAVRTARKQSAGFSTDTLVGAVRELFEREAADRRGPEAAGLVGSLSVALGDRVKDRVGLLTQLLRAPEWEARYDAVRPAKVLMENWRGEYRELVVLIGEQLVDAQPRLSAVAAEGLAYLDELAAPSADALARSLDNAPREAPHTYTDGPPAWITVWPRPGDLPTVGPTLRALTALRDTRALPAVRWVLEHPNMPGDIGVLAGRFGPAAADLVPLIRRRLQDLPVVAGHDRRGGLVVALGRIGAAAAAAVPELLSLLPDPIVLVALGRIGPGAAEAIPMMRRLLGDGQPQVQIAAASALWRVDPDPGPVLPVLARYLDGDASEVRAAAEGLAELGPAAAGTAPRLRELLRAADVGGWRSRVAKALWRATADTDTTLPVLSAEWSENRYARIDVARCLAEMGPAAAAAAPLLREELGRRRRHTSRDNGWSSHQVQVDLELLHACHAGLAAAGR